MANGQPIAVILSALRNTLNSQDSVRKPAEALLRDNETVPRPSDYIFPGYTA